MNIGEVIRKRRKASGLTLEQLALAAGTDGGNLSRVERGTQRASTEVLESLALALNITVSSLYLEVETKTVEQGVGYDQEAVQVKKLYLALAADNRKLALEFMKWLGKQQKNRPGNS